MAVAIGKTDVKVKSFGEQVIVPSSDFAKLMYYFDCVCTCVKPDADATIRRLRDYRNGAHLSRDDEARLLSLCLTLSPDKLIGTIMFPSDDCGGYDNEFLEVSAVSTKLVVAESLVIGGQSKKIQRVMLYRKSWMEENYLDPLRSIVRSRTPPPRSDSCVIL